MYSFEIRIKKRASLLLVIFSIELVVLANAIRKEVKRDIREKIKLQYFPDDMNVYREQSTESVHKLIRTNES